jgi:hypothetical protein
MGLLSVHMGCLSSGHSVELAYQQESLPYGRLMRPAAG